MWGPWQDRVERLFGARRTSGDRSPEEQRALIARGATQATDSEHLTPDHAIDLPVRIPTDVANNTLQLAGIPGYAIYEPGGRNQGTGPHLHIQRDPLRRAAARANGDLPVTSRRDRSVGAGRSLLSPDSKDQLRDLAVTEGPQPASLTNNDSNINDNAAPSDAGAPVVDPFTVGPEIRRRAGAVESELAGQQRFIAGQAADVAEVQTSRRDRLERVVDEKARVNQTMEETNRALLDRVNPLLQRSQQINDRLGELATMNPLERGLRGIFDLRYNHTYLARQREELTSAIHSAGETYQFATTLQEQYMHQLDVGNENAGALDTLKLTELDENGRLHAQGLNAAMSSFDALNHELEANSGVMRAQILARSTLLDNMDAGQINSLLSQARQSNGVVTVQGVPIHVGELQQRSSQWEQLNLSLQNQRVALQSNNLQLAEANARRIAGSMTEAQLQQAAAANGVWHGVQIPSDVITQQLHGYSVRHDILANNFMTTGQAGNAAQVMRLTIDGMRTGYQRVQTIGPVPTHFSVEQTATMNRIRFLGQRLLQATREGVADDVAPAILTEIRTLQTGYETRIRNMASSITGGAPHATQMLNQYFRGDPINSNEATAAMLEFVDQGGLPTSMRGSPTFQAIYDITARAAATVDAANRNANRRPPAAERNRAIQNIVRQQAPQAVNQANMEQVFPALPAIARTMHHPAARINPDDLLRAQQQGNQDGYAQVSSRLGVTPQDAARLDAGAWTPPQGMTPQQAQQIRDGFNRMRGELASTQQSAFLRHLDESPSASENFIPSRAFVDLVSSNGFLQRVNQFEQHQRNYSFGDALASSMGNGSLVPMAAQYGARMRSLANHMQIEAVGSNRRTYAAYQNVPQVRAMVIMGAMDGLQEHDENVLMSAVRRAVPSVDQPQLTGQTNTSVRDFIMSNRFRDPNLERIRRIAAAQWDQTATQMDRGMSRMAWRSQVGESAANLLYGPEEGQ